MGKDKEVGETKTLACAAVVGTVKDSMVETEGMRRSGERRWHRVKGTVRRW